MLGTKQNIVQLVQTCVGRVKGPKRNRNYRKVTGRKKAKTYKANTRRIRHLLYPLRARSLRLGFSRQSDIRSRYNTKVALLESLYRDS